MKSYWKGLIFGAVAGLFISLVFLLVNNISGSQLYYNQSAFIFFLKQFVWFFYWYPSLLVQFVGLFFWSMYRQSPAMEAFKTILPAVVSYSIIGVIVSYIQVPKRVAITILVALFVCVATVASYGAISEHNKNNLEYSCRLKFPNPNTVCTTSEFMDGTDRCRNLQDETISNIATCVANGGK